jgi:hypothetical protein
VLGGVDGSLYLTVPSMNRLNQTEPATFSILSWWAFFRDSYFLYFIILATMIPIALHGNNSGNSCIQKSKPVKLGYVPQNSTHVLCCRDVNVDGNLHFPVPSMNRLNQTEPATFSILPCWAFFRDSAFIYFKISMPLFSHWVKKMTRNRMKRTDICNITEIYC